MAGEIATGKLRKFFTDIVRGFTIGKVQQDTVYIKHLDVSDYSDLDQYYLLAFNQAKEKGILTLDESLKRLNLKGLWKTEDEISLDQKKSYIDNLVQTKNKLILEAQISDMDRLIMEATIGYAEKLSEKNSLIGLTCEKHANGRLNNYFIFCSFYKTKELDDRLFSANEFDEMDTDTIDLLVMSYNKEMESINTDTIKKIAISNFFQNTFYLAESIYEYWGKALVNLTMFQSELSSYGKYYRSLLQQNQELPDDIKNDPDKLVKFIEDDAKIKEQLKSTGADKNNGTGNFSITGMSAEEYKKRGMQTNNDIAKKAREVREKEGRGLTSIEIANIEGVTFTR